MPDPQTQQPDVGETFQSLPRDRQEGLLKRMSPEQKSKLKASIMARKGKATESKKTDPAAPKNTLEAMGQLGSGFAKGALETGTALSPLINKIPGIGETLAPKAGIEAGNKIAESKNVGESIGKGAESLVEFVAGGEAFDAMSAALKAKNIPTVVKLLKEHPYLSKLVEAGVKNYGLGGAQAIAHNEANPGTSAAISGAMGIAGEAYAASSAARKASNAVKTQEAANRYLGLSQKDLPKWERLNVQDVRDVGKTVLEKVGIKGSLEDQALAIESARDAVQAQTESLIKGVPGRAVPVHADLSNITQSTAKHFLDAGKDINGATTNAANSIFNEFKGLTNPNITAEEALKLRRTIANEIKWDKLSDTENVRQYFLGELYDSLNRGIKNAMPNDVASKFESFNRTQSRLIIARDAARDAVVKKGLSPTAVGGAVAGAIGGGYEGSKHGVKGAVAGAALGAAAGATAGKMAGDPKIVLRSRQAIERLTPMMEAVAKKSPAAASAIRAAMGDKNTGSVGSNQ